MLAFYKQRTAIILFLLFIFITGSIAVVNVAKEEFPEVKVPLIYVSVYLRGVSAEDAETLIVKPLEKRLRSIANVKKINGNATVGYASVSIEFLPEVDSAKALNDIRNKVNEAKADMPTDITEPIIKEIDFSQMPVLTIALTSDTTIGELILAGKFLKKKIEEMPDVLEVNLIGDRREILRCEINPSKWFTYKLTVGDVSQALANNNQLVAAGELVSKNNAFNVNIAGLANTVNQMINIPVKTSSDSVIRFGDIARISRDFEAATQMNRVNFRPSIGIEVSKRAGSNLLKTIATIRSIVEKNKDSLPLGVQIVYSRDSSANVLSRLTDLFNAVLIAIIMVVVVVVVQIGTRQGVVVGIGIPISFLLAILCISQMGYTMNTMVLFACIMSVGMIVDASIIVTEYADRRILDGVIPSSAYIEAAGRMAIPVLSATIGLIAVYMPLLFWPGVVGGFMKFIPITLIVTLSASIIVAMIFVPILGGMWCDRVYKKDRESLFRQPLMHNFMERFTNAYVQKLEKTIAHPYRVVVFTVGLFFVTIFAYGKLNYGTEFFIQAEPDYLTISVRSKENSSIEYKNDIMVKIEQIIKEFKEDVQVFYTTVRQNERMLPAKDTIGTINLRLKDWDKRRRAIKIVDDLRAKLADFPGVIVDVSEEKRGPLAAKAIEAQVLSEDRNKANAVADKLFLYMNEDPLLINVSDSRNRDKLEFVVGFDRAVANKHDISINSFGGMLSMLTVGSKVGKFTPTDSDEMLDIMLFMPAIRRNADYMRNVPIVNTRGQIVSSSVFTNITLQPSLSIIERLNGFNVVKISSDIRDPSGVPKALKNISDWFAKNNQYQKDVMLNFGGDDENQKETMAFLNKAFMIAIFIKVAILIIQFNSLYYTLIVMSSVVLSIIGVLWALLMMGKMFSIVMCGLGLISLAGIVVSNNIIFIDTYQRLLHDGHEIKDAILHTAKERLRPILMTSATTIIGLVPMVFNFGIDFTTMRFEYGSPSGQWWEQLSITIAGGLICTTLFTLFLTPAILAIYSPRTK